MGTLRPFWGTAVAPAPAPAAPSAPTTPQPAAGVLAVDVSNFTSPLTSSALQNLWNAGVRLVIAQAVQPASGASVTVQQLVAAKAFGFAVEAYVYQYLTDPAWITQCLALLDQAAAQGVVPDRLWLDVEDVSVTLSPAATVAAIDRDLAALQAWSKSSGVLQTTGVYSGAWWWPRTGNATKYAAAGVPLWPSQYDGVADPDVFTPFGGWTSAQVAIKQFAGTSVLAGVTGLDLDEARAI